MTLPELHLAAEAIAAHVDGELAAVPRERANAHLAKCLECRNAVAEQRRAKAALTVAAGPRPSDDLVARLRDIPQTTDLVAPGIVLAVEHDELVWASAASLAHHGRGRRAGHHQHGDQAGGDRAHAAGDARPADRPASRAEHPARLHRISVGFAGVAAAAIVGMLAASAAVGSSATDTSGEPAAPPAHRSDAAPAGSVPGSGHTEPVDNAPLFVQRPLHVLPAAVHAGATR